MPTVSCTRQSCEHNHENACVKQHIRLKMEHSNCLVLCLDYQKDLEYEAALTLAGRNPQLSAEKVEGV